MKKLFALLLALMMFAPALSVAEMPMDTSGTTGVIGGADGPTSIFTTSSDDMATVALEAGRRINSVLSITRLDGVETGEPTVDVAVADLLKALGLRISQQGSEIDGAVQISGNDALTLGGAVSGEDLYLNSNLLGGTIVIGASEVESLISRLLDMFVLMDAMSEDDAAQIKAVLAETIATVEQSVAESMESAMSLQDLASYDFSALMEMFTMLMGKITQVEEPVVPKMCDPAVAGVQITLNNEEMKQLVKNIFQFLLDNPALMTMMELPQADVERAMTEVENQTLVDGEVKIAAYEGEAGIVYAVVNWPFHDNGETTQIDIAYTRQTVSAGVSYVVNMTVDGETVTVDALAANGQVVINLYGVDGTKALDMTIKTAQENTLRAEMNCYEDEQKILAMLLEGDCEFNDVREYFGGKLTITLYEGSSASAAADMPIDTSAANAAEIPGETMVFQLSSDYAINGVDFTGLVKFGFDVAGIGMDVQIASETTEAKASIVSSDAVRPAAMDDAAFQNWFVQIITNVSTSVMSVLPMLPESVLTLIMASGM